MSIGVGLGLSNFTFSSSEGYWRWVRFCDETGVDSIWQTDRLVSREPFLECLTTMAALAGATKKVKFGMNVAAMGLRDPLVTAKQCATVDYLSGGRMLPAFGTGSNRAPDWKASGRPTAKRGERLNEALEIMIRLWKEESVSYAGSHYNYEDASISPRPVQKTLPCWIGGSSKAAIERTGRYGTGWQASFERPEEVTPVIAAIHEATARHGRKIDADHMGTGIAARFGSWEDPPVQHAAKAFEARTGRSAREGLAVGGTEEIVGRLRDFVDHGISKFILRPIGAGDDDMMAQTERFVAEVLPEVARMNGKG